MGEFVSGWFAGLATAAILFLVISISRHNESECAAQLGTATKEYVLCVWEKGQSKS